MSRITSYFLPRLALGLALCVAVPLAARDLSVMVFSDPHVLSTSLFTDGTQFADDQLLTEHSQALFDQAITQVLAAHPDVLLIPGDLTYHGDDLSHQHIASQLQQLTQAGIQVCVTPGNHDINETLLAPMDYGRGSLGHAITAAEFSSLYSEFSTQSAQAIAPDGLSYMTYLDDALALVVMNSTRDNASGHQSAGGLTEAVLSWAESSASAARATGRQVIGMTHHQLTEHFDHQASVDQNHIANLQPYVEGLALEQVQRRLTAAGFRYVLTGHFHIQSTSCIDTPSGTLYDISTNSLSGCSPQIRTLTFNHGELSGMTSTLLSGWDKQSLAEARNKGLAKDLLYSMTSQYGITGITASVLVGLMADSFNLMLCYLIAGDEDQSDTSSGLSAILTELIGSSIVSAAIGDKSQDIQDIIASVLGNTVAGALVPDAILPADLHLTDGIGFRCPVSYTASTATYTRTVASQWGTIVLPFSLTASSADPYSLYQLSHVGSDLLLFSPYPEGTFLPAGTPCVFSLAEAPASPMPLTFTATATQVSSDLVMQPSATGWTLQGSFTPQELTTEGLYYIANDQFWLKTAGQPLHVRPYRAWFDAGASHARSSYGIEATDLVTSRQSLTSAPESTACILDLQGHPLTAVPAHGTCILLQADGTSRIITLQ